ncbi:hypothetical protein LNO88_14870 [Klebsiella pneumoniae subsp. pneumoniae]|nr:hypothetical protein [Klebsiella pneumoniae subsp. pneumoniae]
MKALGDWRQHPCRRQPGTGTLPPACEGRRELRRRWASILSNSRVSAHDNDAALVRLRPAKLKPRSSRMKRSRPLYDGYQLAHSRAVYTGALTPR